MAGPRHIIPVTVLVDGDATPLRRSLDQSLGSFRADVVSTARSAATPQARSASAQRQFATEEGAQHAQIRQLEQAGKITSKVATEARAEVTRFFDTLRREAAAELKLQKINPPTVNQLEQALRKIINTAEQAARSASGAGAGGGGRKPPPAAPGPSAPRDPDDWERGIYGANRPTMQRTLRGFERDFKEAVAGQPLSVPANQNAQVDGMNEAMRRFYGLLVGYNQSLAEGEGEFSRSLVSLRAMVTAQRAYQDVIERSAQERAVLERLSAGGERDLFKATADLATAREQRSIRERQAERLGRAPLAGDRAEDARARSLERADVEIRRIRGRSGNEGELGYGAEGLRVLGRQLAARRDLANALEVEASASGRSAAATDRAARAQNARVSDRRMVNFEAARQFDIAGGNDVGSWFQRQQANIARRQGQAPRSPLEYQTARQFLTSKALTTGGFALSGGILYGAINLGGDVLRQSTELQQQLALIRTQFEQTGEAAAGVSFDKYRRELAQTAVDTGVAADEVANVQRQLAGAFSDPDTGALNFRRASDEGRVALRYSKVSSLPLQEITDSYTAVALAFRDADGPKSFEEIADLLTMLENRFGVLGPEILKFTADLAPLGKELGFTAEQLAGLGAVAQKASGKSGQVLAEQLGRILPQMKEKSSELFDLFNANAATAPDAGKLLTAFASGDAAQALEILVRNYDRLDKAQQNTLANLVGGSRQAQTFYALLDQSADTLRVLDPNGLPSDEGAFDRRWQTYKETVTANLEQMRRAVEEFGQIIFEAGLGDFLSEIADKGKFAIGALSVVVRLLGEVNQLLGGLPARAAGFLVLAKAADMLRRAVAGWLGVQTVANAAAGGGPGVGRAAAAGSRFTGFFGNRALAGGFGSAYRPQQIPVGPDGLPLPIALGAGAPLEAKWGTRQAMNSPLLSRFIKKNAAGNVQSGFSTGVANALAVAAPLFAAYMVSELYQTVEETRARMEGAKEDFRAKVAEQLEKGVSADELRKRAAGVGGKDPSTKLPIKLALGPLGLTPVGDYLGGKADDYLGLNVDDDVEQVIAEEEARSKSEDATALARLLADRAEARGFAITKALDAEGSKGAKDILRDLLNNDSKATGGVKARRGRAAEDLSDNITADDITELANRINDDPTNKSLQEALQLIIDNAGLDPATASALNALLDDLADGKARKEDISAAAEQVAKNAEAQQDFVTRLAALRSSYAAGTGATVSQIVDLIREKRSAATKILRDFEAQGLEDTPEYAAQQKIVDDLTTELVDRTILADATAVRTIADDVADRSGRDPLTTARTKTANAKAYFDTIARTREASVAQKAAAARELLDAQAEEFDLALGAASSPEEFNRIMAEGIARDPQARKYVIAESLTVGAGAQVIDKFKDVLGLSTGKTRALVAQAIADANGVNEAIQIAAVEARREQIQAALDALTEGKVIGKDISLAALEGAGLNDLSAIDEALSELKALNPTSFDPGPTERGNVIDNLSKAQEFAAADAAVAQARAGNDAVAAARAAAQAAQANLERVRAANPGDYAAIRNAEAQVISTETALGNAIRSRAQALRQAAFDLQRVGANGNSAALAQIDIAAARSMIANAEAGPAGDQDRAAGEVALAQGYLAARQAAIAQQAAQGQYLASLLSGDSVAQNQQLLANAQQALANSTADNRFAALSAVVDAQRALQNAITEALTSQIDVAIAVAEGGGETVKVAFLQLQQAQIRFDRAQQAGLRGAQLDAAKADLIRAQNNAADVARQDRIGDLDYLYQMEQITAAEYIKGLEAELAQIPESNKKLRQEIALKIKGLRDQMGQNSEFNIPDVVLPTLYEARRLGQRGTWNGASTVITDNRDIDITIVEAGDLEATTRAVADVMNSAPRSGSATTGEFV